MDNVPSAQRTNFNWSHTKTPKGIRTDKKRNKTRPDLVRVESDGTIKVFDVQSRLETDLTYERY